MNAVATPLVARDRLARFARLMEVASAFRRAIPNNPAPPMDISLDDIQVLFRSLYKHDVQFMLIGGMASVLYGANRTTADLDLWIRADDANKNRLIDALTENDVVGAEYLREVPLLFGRTRPGWTSVRVGKSGFELDMGHALKAFADTDFDTCYARAKIASFDEVPFRVISMADLIIEKQATGRGKDLDDVNELIKLQSYNVDQSDVPDVG